MKKWCGFFIAPKGCKAKIPYTRFPNLCVLAPLREAYFFWAGNELVF